MALSPLLKSRGRPILDTTPWKQQEKLTKRCPGADFEHLEVLRYRLISSISSQHHLCTPVISSLREIGLPTTTELYLSRYLKATQA
ncbi:hypothetical protein DTO027B5_1052 [Paecilomyces variotii]|nr:hypothetical protein DTO027B3_1196 [Paecilomyces variotii]KAJ9337254.1 hypothetical protein DTO027B5_1052 [Paecilomyces variotii]